jgi:hydrogenase maturation protease
MARDVIIGIGNPIVSDDAVGIAVARCCRAELPPFSDVSVKELYCGGLQLMEAMAGYERAIVIDAIEPASKPGTIYSLGMDDLGAARNTCTTHDGSLADALEFGRISGAKLPTVVHLWAVEAGDIVTFREGLTPEVAAAVPVVTAEIMRELLVRR